jgi:hypothetical protein
MKYTAIVSCSLSPTSLPQNQFVVCDPIRCRHINQVSQNAKSKPKKSFILILKICLYSAVSAKKWFIDKFRIVGPMLGDHNLKIKLGRAESGQNL